MINVTRDNLEGEFESQKSAERFGLGLLTP